MGNEQSNLGGILLVDDDETVLELAHQVLRSAHYTVYKAACGKKALEIFSSHSPEIDLLVSDIVMPQMFGDQLAMRVLQEKPALKYILMSGNPPNSLDTAFSLEEGANFLRKPFTLQELRAIVSQQLQLAGT